MLHKSYKHAISKLPSTCTKVQYFIDNMHFDSDKLAPYLQARPSPDLFSLVKFRLGAHWLRVETDRWLPSKPPRDKRVCQHCHMDTVEDEQHFLFDCSLYRHIRDQHAFLFGTDQGSIRLFLERNADQMTSVAHYIHLCFKPGCPTSHIWLPTPNCKLH